VLAIITDGKQFDPWPPELINQIEKLQLKIVSDKDSAVVPHHSPYENEEERKRNLIASFL
jgi:hypothetical protein